MLNHDLLDDPSGYDSNDGWRVLRRGEDAGTIKARGHLLVLRGGDRCRVDLKNPYDEECGLDAPPGAIGELVAVSERTGGGAIKADTGETYVANLGDLRLAT